MCNILEVLILKHLNAAAITCSSCTWYTKNQTPTDSIPDAGMANQLFPKLSYEVGQFLLPGNIIGTCDLR